MIGELTNHLWQSTLFAVAAGLMAVTFRKNRAHVRYWLWLSASLKFLVPFALLISLGSHLAWVPTAKTTATQAVSFTVAQIAQPFPDTFASGPSAPRTTDRLPIAILGTWACGFEVIALIRFKDCLSVRAAVRSSQPMQIRSANISAAVEVRSSASTLEPGVIGLLCPMLLLPAGITGRLTAPQLAAVFAHEMCHVRRRDNLTAALHMVVEAVFWFHPLVWWIGARLAEERERACDEAVLRLGNEPQVYAQGILNVCKFYAESPVTCVAGVTGSDLKKRVGRIMRNDVGERLSNWRKFVLVAAGVVTLSIPLVAGVLVAPPPPAQLETVRERVVGAGPLHFRYFFQDHKSQTTAVDHLTFEAVSIKRDKGTDPRGTFQFQPGRFVMTNIPLRPLIQMAYKLPITGYQGLILGAPDWVGHIPYDVEAKADGNAPREQMLLMLQSLLTDRFKLTVHWETRQLPVYALTLVKAGKTGPQLVPHAADNSTCRVSSAQPQLPGALQSGEAPPRVLPFCDSQDFVSGGGHIATEATMETLAKDLSYFQQIDRAVVDKTGLSGTFDINIDYAPFVRSAESAAEASGADPLLPSTIFTALKEHLGFKLEPQIGPVKVLVIDRVEQPAEN